MAEKVGNYLLERVYFEAFNLNPTSRKMLSNINGSLVAYGRDIVTRSEANNWRRKVPMKTLIQLWLNRGANRSVETSC